jgi:diguanylate cyclase (GGDEF)-like protein
MFFPKLKEIATTDVVSIREDRSIREAMALMNETDHHCILVVGEKGYSTLSVNKILYAWDIEKRREIPVRELDLKPIPSFSKELNILEALERLEFRFDEILALNDDGGIYGILTYSDIIASIDPETLMGNFRLSHIIKVTRRIPWLPPETPTREILRIMESSDRPSVILVEESRPVGIVTSKDMLRLLMEGNDLERPISAYMTRPVLTISYQSTIAETLDFLKKHHFKRAVAVDEEGRLKGVFTQKEIVAFTYHRWMQILKEQQEKLDRINKLLLRQNLEIEKNSALDPLTGLYNRLKCSELFISEYTVMLQRHNTMSLILMDLDHFKRINDTYGHNTGDRVLEAVAETLRRNLRSVDIACRWGGEEFIILLPASSLEHAEMIADLLRREIARLEFPDHPIALSASFGVTEVRPGQSLSEVIEQADEALYRAKHEGRNRVVTHLPFSKKEADASSEIEAKERTPRD